MEHPHPLHPGRPSISALEKFALEEEGRQHLEDERALPIQLLTPISMNSSFDQLLPDLIPSETSLSSTATWPVFPELLTPLSLIPPFPNIADMDPETLKLLRAAAELSPFLSDEQFFFPSTTAPKAYSINVDWYSGGNEREPTEEFNNLDFYSVPPPSHVAVANSDVAGGFGILLPTVVPTERKSAEVAVPNFPSETTERLLNWGYPMNAQTNPDMNSITFEGTRMPAPDDEDRLLSPLHTINSSWDPSPVSATSSLPSQSESATASNILDSSGIEQLLEDYLNQTLVLPTNFNDMKHMWADLYDELSQENIDWLNNLPSTLSTEDIFDGNGNWERQDVNVPGMGLIPMGSYDAGGV
ncbi:hypothetical protein BDZ91DRAFT_758141 [Kalaharituber pfeilii]|nr:hypothetical protein BDZ91DRAFT_758141 [Kalaharituber pfeilii]